jgi:hypothetical protein
LTCAAWLGLAAPAAFRAGNLIVNGGFENGVYTSAIDGSTDTRVPNGWPQNAACGLEPDFNRLVTVEGLWEAGNIPVCAGRNQPSGRTQ